MTREELEAMGIYGVESESELKPKDDQVKQKIINFAKNHIDGGNLTASIFGAICTHQPPSGDALTVAKNDLLELKNKLIKKSATIFNQDGTANIEIATTFKGKGDAEKYNALYEKINAPDVLPLGAIELAKRIAANIITPFDDNRVLQKNVSTPAMRWGHENEVIALKELAEIVAKDGFVLTEQSFYRLSGVKNTGATPDFDLKIKPSIAEVPLKCQPPIVVGDIKSPLNNEVHVASILRGNNTEQFKKDESGYYWQFQGQMLCSGAREHWKISFNPSFPAEHPFRLHKSVMQYNEADGAFLLNRIKMFWARVEAIIAEVKEKERI